MRVSEDKSKEMAPGTLIKVAAASILGGLGKEKSYNITFKFCRAACYVSSIKLRISCFLGVQTARSIKNVTNNVKVVRVPKTSMLHK